jgi:hypothetical protein
LPELKAQLSDHFAHDCLRPEVFPGMAQARSFVSHYRNEFTASKAFKMSSRVLKPNPDMPRSHG